VDLSLKPQRLAGAWRAERGRAGRLDPALVAVFAVAVSAAGAGRPSLWFDEAATISASTRSLPQLWGMLHNIDAVHGLYYLLMHGWFAVFPATEFWSRFPSCLSVGAAAAGVVVLGKQFSTRSVAVSAGIVFAILPRITWAGTEARSYALSTCAAVWLTVLLVAAIHRNRAVLIPLYAVGLALTTAINLFVVLIVLPHAVAVTMLTRKRSTWVWWAVASATALASLTPFLLFSRTQIAQVAWIWALSGHTVFDIVHRQFFDHSVPFAILTAVVLLTPVLLRRYRRLETGSRQLAGVAVAWIVLPIAALLLYSALSNPIYYPRYLCYTSPGMALLLAVCIVSLAQTRERITAMLVVFAVAATPSYVSVQRGPYAKEGMDFSQVADLITTHASPGDCLIMDNTINWKPSPIRALTAARPAAFAKLVDPGRGPSGPARNWLWDGHIAIWLVLDKVRHCTVLWTVSDRDTTRPAHETGRAIDPGPRLMRAPAYRYPQHLGFHIVERWQFSFAQVTKSTR
jgi:mannosyltransferase